jgi:uncharacterized delta-60 repeat protein
MLLAFILLVNMINNNPMTKRVLLSSLLLLLCFFSTSYAQGFDDHFQPFITRPGDVQQIKVLDDGRFLAAGAFSLANESTYRNIARFFPDGSVDQSFTFDLDFSVSAMALQEDGKIVIGGAYNGSEASQGITVIRLMPDGSVDPSFQAGFAPDGDIEVIAIEFNGTILVGGAFNSFDGQAAQGLVRLAPEGFFLQSLTLEPSGPVFISDLIVTDNGRFYVAGSYNAEGYLSFRTYGGVPINDFNFSPSFPGVNNIMVGIRDIEMDSQGRIVLTTSTFLIRYALVIINQDGSFGDWGYIYGIPMDMIVDSFDNILIAGEYEGVNAVHRFVPGQDLIVYNGGTGCDGLIRQLAEMPNGSYIIGGSFSAFNAAKALSLERLNGFGNPVANFSPALERPGFVRATLLVDDKIYIGGDFAMINGHYSPNIARINLNNGSTDPSFANPGLSYRNIINDIAIDNFDRILLAGTNQNDGDSPAESPLVRILSEGIIDPSFTINPLPLGSISKVLPIPGGLILTAGDFTIFDPGIVASQAALFTSSGSRINDFSERLDAERISSAFRQADGRLLLAGKNISYDNNEPQPIIRLTAALEFDASFTPPAALECDGNCRYTITQQNNGQLLVGGQISLDAQSGLIRLNPDGSNDASFSTPGPFLGIAGFADGQPRAVKPFADGRLLVTGLFDSLGLTPVTSKCILSPEGDLIENFDGLSFDRQSILGGHILDEESFLIYGVLANIDEQEYASIAKVNFSPAVPNTISGTLTAWFGPVISNAEVGLIGTSSANTLSDANGYYEFSDLTAGGVYESIPMLNTSPLNGVSTLDLILISQHILGVAPFTSPYQFLAGDVNNSQSITILDMASIRAVVLGINQTFEDNTSWRFIPTDYTFPSNTNPWLEFFPESYLIANLTAPGPDNINFTGLKIGDVSGDAETQTVAPPTQGRAAAYFRSQPTFDAENDIIEVPFYVDEQQELAGFQFTVAFDPSALELSGIKHGITRDEHFGLSYVEDGYITTSWNTMDMATDISGQALFTLLFNTKTSAKPDLNHLISINSAVTKAEAYTSDFSILKPVFELAPAAADAFALFAATPNPFKDQAALRFSLPEAGQVQLSFYSSDGKLLKEVERFYDAGNNEYLLQSTGLPKGIIYYTLAYNGQRKHGKIVAVGN